MALTCLKFWLERCNCGKSDNVIVSDQLMILWMEIIWILNLNILEPHNDSTSKNYFVTYENFFLSWINPKSDRLSLIKPHLCDSKGISKTYEFILEENIWWARAPIYWSSLLHKTCFWFYFRTFIAANQRFLVHLLDPHVTHKTWFYQYYPS